MKPTNRAEAERMGFVVDDNVYPWVAYKGPRFLPTEWHRILTDRESEARELAYLLVDKYAIYWDVPEVRTLVDKII